MLVEALISVAAALGAIAVSLVVIALSGVPPEAAVRALYDGAFGGPVQVGGTLAKTVLLILVALGWIAGFSVRRVNIGLEGQIVAGGTLEQLAEFAASPPAGARLRPLRVAGAFHTKHMAPAVDALVAAAAGVPVHDPVITLLSNRDGAVVTSGPAWVERIVHQVANPVRWDLCMATMSDITVTAMIELLPGGTLTGMAKRALPGVELLAIKTPDQLDAARALIAAHATATNGYTANPDGSPAEWRLVVSPGAGTANVPA